MRVFVTGATGQIGLPLVQVLVKNGHAVTALVRSESAAAEVRAAGATLLVGHLEDADAIERGVAGAELVMHLAGGLRGPGRVDADRLNRGGTEAIAAAAGRHAARLHGFVYASSCAVYGDRSGLWLGEDYAPAPQTDYGRSKVAAESLLGEVAARTGLKLHVVRIAAVYGPGCRFMQVDRIRAGKAWLPGEGRNLVPVVHVEDCAAALVAIGERGSPGTWHISGPSTPTLREFYGAVAKAIGGQPVRFWSTWVPSVFQFGAARQNELLMSRLGRKPRFTTDNLRLFTASSRLRTDRLEKELEFTWRWPDYREGVAAACKG